MIANSLNRHMLQREGTFVLLLTTLFGGFLFLRPGNFFTELIVVKLLQVIFAVISSLLALPLFLPDTKYKERNLTSLLQQMAFPKTSQQWVATLLSLSILLHGIGQAIVLYHLIIRLPPPSFSWIDIFCLSALIPLLLSILLLPSRPITPEKKIHIILDGMMIMIGAITFSWYFILGPSFLQADANITSRIVNSAYPLGALLLAFCLLLLVIRTNDHSILPVVFFLSLGILSLTITYSIFGYKRLYHEYSPGDLLELGWALGYLLVGLAARAMHISIRSAALSTNTPFVSVSPQQECSSPILWRSLLPYALIPPIILLLVGTFYLGSNQHLESGVYLGAMTLVGLLIIRQIFTVRATVTQNNALHLMQQDLRETNKALTLANGQLEQQARQLEHANEQLSHLNRLRDQFIANVNHELRTPLTLIDGYLELLSDFQGHIDETTQASFIQHAKEGSQELLLLVNNVLDASRINTEITPPRMENVSLSQAVYEVCEQFPPEREQGSRLRVDIPASFVVNADQRYLRQIIRNLLSNALKYSPPDTSVTIHAHIVACPDSPHVYISIQDAGPGIPPSEQTLLFHKFVRLKRDITGPIRGTGLGLYMCKQLVEAMHGEIWVESSGKKGEGSRFCFTLISAIKSTTTLT